jgi:acyl-CoA hydrolase
MRTIDANMLGNVHGGEIMKLADTTAGAVAFRHCGGPAVTAAMDEMAFLNPVRRTTSPEGCGTSRRAAS